MDRERWYQCSRLLVPQVRASAQLSVRQVRVSERQSARLVQVSGRRTVLWKLESERRAVLGSLAEQLVVLEVAEPAAARIRHRLMAAVLQLLEVASASLVAWASSDKGSVECHRVQWLVDCWPAFDSMHCQGDLSFRHSIGC
jgi:hypothetical protein